MKKQLLTFGAFLILTATTLPSLAACHCQNAPYNYYQQKQIVMPYGAACPCPAAALPNCCPTAKPCCPAAPVSCCPAAPVSCCPAAPCCPAPVSCCPAAPTCYNCCD